MTKRLSSFIYMFLVIIAIFTYITVNIIIFGVNAKPEKSDVILILGTWAPKGVVPDSVLARRLNKGLELYKEGIAPYIIVSGGHGVDEKWPEAEVMRDYLIDNGVDPLSIFIENKSFTTWENMQYSKDIIDEYSFKSVVITSSFFHLARTKIISKRLGYPKVSFAKAIKSSHVSKMTIFVILREVFAYISYGLFYFDEREEITNANV